MTTTQLHELLEQNVSELSEACQHLYGLGQFSLEVATDASVRAAGAATLLSAIGHILVTKGVCTPEELTDAIMGAEAAMALGTALTKFGEPEEGAEEEEAPGPYPEDAVIFGGNS